jgi:Fe-S-cluster-containing dehydrogenase component
MTFSRQAFLRLSGFTFLAATARKLIAGPSPTRWGMAIDTAKCASQPNCTKCIDACHLSHNVPKIADVRHDVTWIRKEPFAHAFHSQVDEYSSLAAAPAMVLCNHCDNPPCVRVCPTQATWKREDGIVAMDWHRCIGCRYCMAACPYGSRSFNFVDPRPQIAKPNPDYPTRTKGVVEKCTFCAERLAVGRVPICVEACTAKALVFGNLADPKSQIRQLLAARHHIRRKPELGTRPEVFYIV